MRLPSAHYYNAALSMNMPLDKRVSLFYEWLDFCNLDFYNRVTGIVTALQKWIGNT